MIGKFWTGGYKRFAGDKIVELVETKPPVFLDGLMHLKTHLHTDGTDGGHVLLPFASKRFYVDGPKKDKDGNLILDDGIIQYTKINIDPGLLQKDSAQYSLQTHHYGVIIILLFLGLPIQLFLLIQLSVVWGHHCSLNS